MNIDLVARGTRYDIPGDETVNNNFAQLFTDVRAIVMALKAKRINLASADDVIGGLTLPAVLQGDLLYASADGVLARLPRMPPGRACSRMPARVTGRSGSSRPRRRG